MSWPGREKSPVSRSWRSCVCNGGVKSSRVQQSVTPSLRHFSRQSAPASCELPICCRSLKRVSLKPMANSRPQGNGGAGCWLGQVVWLSQPLQSLKRRTRKQLNHSARPTALLGCCVLLVCWRHKAHVSCRTTSWLGMVCPPKNLSPTRQAQPPEPHWLTWCKRGSFCCPAPATPWCLGPPSHQCCPLCSPAGISQRFLMSHFLAGLAIVSRCCGLP